jgi:hypothetical protein
VFAQRVDAQQAASKGASAQTADARVAARSGIHRPGVCLRSYLQPVRQRAVRLWRRRARLSAYGAVSEVFTLWSQQGA